MMNEFMYLVYDGGDLLAGFPMLVTAVNFTESYRADSNIPLDLVSAEDGEVLDTWVNGRWENGTY